MSLFLEKGYTTKKMEKVNADAFEWLKEKIKNPVNATNKDKAIYFISGTMKKNERNNENLLTRDLLVLDYDHLQNYKYNNQSITYAVFEKQIQEKLAKYDYLTYPTYSASETEINYRVVIKLDRPLNKAEYRAVGTQIAYNLALPIDLSCIKTWSQVQGVPVITKNNQSVIHNAVVNNGIEYETVPAELFEEHKDTIEDRAKAMVKEIEQRTKPKKDHASDFDKASYNLTINTEKAHTGQILDDYNAIAVMNEYIKYNDLIDYNDYLSAEAQIINAVKKEQISHDAGLECVEILANDNDEWKESNRQRFEKRIEQNEVITNQNYDFIGKFLLTLPDPVKQKYRHLLPARTPQEVHHNNQNNQIDPTYEKFLQADLTKYTYDNLPKDWLQYLNHEQKTDLINGMSAFNQLDKLEDYIDASLEQKNISTGFKCLDKMLDGGLHVGLHFVGAISSLGKTTLLMQLADNIAKQDIPVVIFSLEMSKFELMSKSLSRLTFDNAVKNKTVYKPKMKQGDELEPYALNFIQISDKKRYKDYDPISLNLLKQAKEEYKTFAKNIFIKEGVGDVSTKEVTEVVKDIHEVTGQAPVIIVDYLQILAPENDSKTDKQNTDRAVLHLKQLSRDYNTPVIAISSLNRASYTSEISMSAFKESGAVEYSSDVLIGLQFSRQREVDKANSNKPQNQPRLALDHNEEKMKEPREIELKLLKNRNGVASGSIDYKFHAQFNKYEEIGFVKKNKAKATTQESDTKEDALAKMLEKTKKKDFKLNIKQ